MGFRCINGLGFITVCLLITMHSRGRFNCDTVRFLITSDEVIHADLCAAPFVCANYGCVVRYKATANPVTG
jgi:hypothetical protein